MIPNVLVLMTTYNGEKFIGKQIESILNQEKVNANIIIRDDGSSDSTVSKITRIQEKFSNVEFINAKDDEKHGPMHNYYSLLQIVKTKYLNQYEYFALSDQDDVWMPNKLNTLIRASNNDVTPQLIYGNYCVIDENDNVQIKDVDEQIGLSFKTPLDLLVNNSYAWGHSILFNAKLLSEINLDHEVINTNFPHDAYLAKFAAICDGLTYVPDVLVKYRRHNHNVSGMWYGLNIKLLLDKLNLIKEAKIYANLINATCFAIQKNKTSKFVKYCYVDNYSEIITSSGFRTLQLFRKFGIRRKQRTRDINMKMTYMLGIYKKWSGKQNKLVIK